ncbi:activating transcription factor 3 [Eupeodes corollae]|uniref:activating transcription factor 3 n=1 Tax=Eupeodes corollae TaxID=290404 RepID=UPI002492FB50|nr:activating transcription factor 3 [Eupeodes corollae]XP_055907993.1 activating transcription factor 3 [Eupeodes corollae]XP_055907994.1 activating transcription factor 3 [Eupeodes corollae]
MRMFNLNIPQTLGLDAGSTPKTPEIVNSLMAMSNPMDNYFTSTQGISVRSFNSMNPQAISQDSSHSSCSGSPLDSPAGTATTPSVQQTCSQLIKAGLKLSIQSKRKLSTCESSSGSEQTTSKCSRKDEDTSDEEDCDSKSIKGLTPEDEDRRRRRRERNKIAATKCRMKKRERTQYLMKESEQLDTQNIDLKNQVRTLELERQQLFDMLQAHSPSCVRRGGFNPPAKLLQSPAQKYLADLELDIKPFQTSESPVPVSNQQASTPTQTQHQQQQQQQQRTVIPPMSTINNRSNVFKATTAAIPSSPHHHQTSNNNHHSSDIIPNGYCKPSPTAQELGYLSSPAQDVCLPQMQQQQSHLLHSNHQQHHQHLQHHPVVSQALISDYIPNCDSSLTPTSDTTSDFVKNELVDSQSPYTTAQSAERFLFESENFDLKHSNNACNNNNTSNHNANIVDFHGPMGGTTTIVPFHDHISIKNDLLSVQEADFLSHLTGDPTDSDYVDLDTGVAAAFSQMTNGGCLA